MLSSNPRTLYTKLLLALIITIISVLVCSSCGLKTIKEEDQMVIETKEEAVQLFEYLKTKDTENLSLLFSQKKQAEHDLIKELKEFYEELDDNFVSYESLETMTTHRSCYNDEIELMEISVIFKNVKMESGKQYEKLSYCKTSRNINRPETEGIDILGLKIGEDENGWIQLTVGDEKNTAEE